MLMPNANVNQMVHFLRFQDLKPKMILLLDSCRIKTCGLVSMILNERADTLQLMEVIYHIPIGIQVNQITIDMVDGVDLVMRMGL